METILQCFYAFVASAATALFFQIRRPVCILSSALIGMLGWSLHCLTRDFMSISMSYLIAALGITLACELSARLFRAPSTVFLFPGIIPLVPGGGMYYTMSYLIAGDYVNFAVKGMETVSLAGSIAVGVCMVTAFVRMLSVRPGK